MCQDAILRDLIYVTPLNENICVIYNLKKKNKYSVLLDRKEVVTDHASQTNLSEL